MFLYSGFKECCSKAEHCKLALLSLWLSVLARIGLQIRNTLAWIIRDSVRWVFKSSRCNLVTKWVKAILWPTSGGSSRVWYQLVKSEHLSQISTLNRNASLLRTPEQSLSELEYKAPTRRSFVRTCSSFSAQIVRVESLI